MKYGKAVRLGRAIRGITRTHLAYETGLSDCFISFLEIERQSASEASLRSIALAVGLPWDLFEFLASEQADVALRPAREVSDFACRLIDIIVEAGNE